MIWQRIVGFRLVAADIERLTRFYQKLGFAAGPRVPIPSREMELLGLSGGGTRQHLTLGPSRVDLDVFEQQGRAYPDDADAASLCFQHLALVTDDAARDWNLLAGHGARRISRSGPVTLPASAGGVTAIKFRDPDGHPLELLQFPDGAAHGWPGQGLLGIDHSAISVANAATSQAFYEGVGLAQGKTSLNTGPTQVTLDGLDDVEVEVVPMQPAMEPPHLELLNYRRPKGRFTGLLSPNDVAATRVVWQADAEALVRDPDGHLHQLVVP